MKIQEKIWVVLDANGSPVGVKPTREKARKMKKSYEVMLEVLKELAPGPGPYTIVQYKRWKKAS